MRVLAANPHELRGTCIDCNDMCFAKSATVKARSQKLPTVELTLNNWWTVADTLRQHFDNAQWGEYAALLEYGICRRGIITADSIEMLEMFIRLGGTSRLRTPQEFYDLPAQYVDVVDVIELEKKMIQKEQHDATK